MARATRFYEEESGGSMVQTGRATSEFLILRLVGAVSRTKLLTTNRPLAGVRPGSHR